MYFVADGVTLRQVFLQILRFSPVSIIPPILHTLLHLRVAVTKKPRNLPNSKAVSNVGSLGQKITVAAFVTSFA